MHFYSVTITTTTQIYLYRVTIPSRDINIYTIVGVTHPYHRYSYLSLSRAHVFCVLLLYYRQATNIFTLFELFLNLYVANGDHKSFYC